MLFVDAIQLREKRCTRQLALEGCETPAKDLDRSDMLNALSPLAKHNWDFESGNDVAQVLVNELTYVIRSIGSNSPSPTLFELMTQNILCRTACFGR